LGIEKLFTLGEQSHSAGVAFGDSRHFTGMAELSAAVVDELPHVASMLVKGSRFMKMERVVEAAMAAGADSQKEDKKAPHAA
jgi:UDP-N-acetylmuramoyl-tripeptide--D-alanyl-D-alanine ligase